MKNPFKSGSAVKKIVIALIVLTVVAFVLKAPIEAASAVDSAKDSGTNAIDSLVAFFRALG